MPQPRDWLDTWAEMDITLNKQSACKVKKQILKKKTAHADRIQAEQALKVRLTAAETELHLLREQKTADHDRRDKAEQAAKELESDLDRWSSFCDVSLIISQ